MPICLGELSIVPTGDEQDDLQRTNKKTLTCRLVEITRTNRCTFAHIVIEEYRLWLVPFYRKDTRSGPVRWEVRNAVVIA
ncbi:hypothetical protein EVAR_7783_1 [Eumeta japonica]|uniref:Uncharacterized protein n=1 Tax=Eumeta variegata TaxID=151549 RepID=A0A4C1TM42_EUMVA|nr:hypothetical protein EVAR_7783_1 [Eumeta japonica]